MKRKAKTVYVGVPDSYWRETQRRQEQLRAALADLNNYEAEVRLEHDNADWSTSR